METTTTFFENILKIRHPWSIKSVTHTDSKNRVDLYVEHASSVRFPCPKCNEFSSIYDHSSERIFRHLNVFHLCTYIHVCIPRVQCKTHGVQQIEHGLSESNGHVTYEFERLVLDLEHECSIESVSRLLHIDWHLCQTIQERAVSRGKERKGTMLPTHLSVDEKSFAKGHKYETIICDTLNSTVEDVIDHREQKSLESYYKEFSDKERAAVECVTMDMWDPYIAATKAYIPDADNKIVFDRYHVTRIITQAVDTVRKQEHKKLLDDGIDILKGTKYLWLWNEENIPEFRKSEFERLRNQDLKVSKAYTIKENLRNLWNYKSQTWMEKYFTKWYFWATHSRIKPLVDAAKTLKAHIKNIITYAKFKTTNAISESINSKIEKFKRFACGYRNRMHYKIAILFHCGGLDLYPKRKMTPLQIMGS